MGNIIVTGAYGALGRAVVAELGARGHAVAAVDLAPAPEGFEARLALGGVDLTDEQAVEAAYAQVAAQFGSIDGLVNIAGGFVWEPMEGGSLDNWDRMYRMNLRTAAVSSRAALGHLLAAGGAIVNVGAAGAAQPGMGMAPYAASKAGVRALTESLAEEMRSRNVRVNAILPTIIDTPTNRADMPDADRSGWVRPEAVARVVAFLLSAESAAITGAGIPLSLAG
ncbi:SDR family NAD(P)-dependent oxidoreductase [Sphingobium sp. C100]|uniref:SDR family NAD(P)-dependent oxidoreductase n=1 Tax=Sphingobium sp. C100 TaxID=1207055 RepID=UPI0004CF9204|nr:SDR family NAD(P)-dependent oxidoreductase [Sphingobium sp. C100]